MIKRDYDEEKENRFALTLTENLLTKSTHKTLRKKKKTALSHDHHWIKFWRQEKISTPPADERDHVAAIISENHFGKSSKMSIRDQLLLNQQQNYLKTSLWVRNM
jgi:hypothetical protein